MQFKRCSKCHALKSVDEFYTYKNGNPRAYCKLCHSKDASERRKRYNDRVPTNETKLCKYCNRVLPISQFTRNVLNSDGLCGRCLECDNKLHQSEDHYKSKHLPMCENKECASYLGIHIAEQVLSKVFKDVERMSPTFPSYDFICNNGYKIDVKSSCIRTRQNVVKRWMFNIKKNTIPDFFLCIAFDNRKDLNPLHLWLIPSKEISHLKNFTISLNTLNRWNKYKKDINPVIKEMNNIIS